MNMIATVKRSPSRHSCGAKTRRSAARCVRAALRAFGRPLDDKILSEVPRQPAKHQVLFRYQLAHDLTAKDLAEQLVELIPTFRKYAASAADLTIVIGAEFCHLAGEKATASKACSSAKRSRRGGSGK